MVEDDEIEIERVCISDFDVKEIKNDGQVVLVGEVNPRAILIVIGVLVGEAVISYVVSEIIDKWRNRRSIESKDDPIPIWRGRDIVLPVPLFDIRTPPQKLDGFCVTVRVFDIDAEWRETVNVYFISGGTTLRLGTLNTGASDTTTWTWMGVPFHQLDTIYNALVRNDGKFQIKFEKVTNGWARIDWFKIRWSW